MKNYIIAYWNYIVSNIKEKKIDEENFDLDDLKYIKKMKKHLKYFTNTKKHDNIIK